MPRTVKEVWKIEVADVVADDEIWVNLLQEVPPCRQHLFFPFIFEDFCIDNQTRRIKTENIPHKRFLLSVSSDNICDLNDRILVGFREDSFSTSALDIEGQYTKRCHLCPFSFRFVCY